MNDPNTAPTDVIFLGDFGWPWPVPTHWNEAIGKWSYANLQVGLFEGSWNDPYWETENESKSELRGWLPMPEIPESHRLSKWHKVFVPPSGGE